MKIFTIDTGLFKLDGGAMFGVVPKSMWQKLNAPDENNMCSWAARCLLLQDGPNLILIDTGLGDKQSPKFFDRYYLHGDDTLVKSLAKHGFKRSDITDVFLTHLHFDHCGGAIIHDGESLVPAFENAVYWSNRKHWNWAIYANEREKASFLEENIIPIRNSGKLQFIEVQDGVFFTDTMKIRFVYGHTDAMMLPQITYKGKTILYVSDLIPSVAHIPLPYVAAYDMFPMQTLKEKQFFLQEAYENDYILFFEHDPVNECGTLQKTDKGFRIKETFKLSDLG
ncbi:MAG: fold metallo-hydrolase [Sphingobacteriales bacterium]|nr:fold metallo-hydrolase [Sphingobacteriales bacterium]